MGITYVREDAARPSALQSEQFDGVVCNFGLSDIDDLDGAFATVDRVLPDGGWFVFSILHPCFPGWDADAPSSWSPDEGYYTEGWWLAENTGFRGQVGATHRMFATYLLAAAARTRCATPSPVRIWSTAAMPSACSASWATPRCPCRIGDCPEARWQRRPSGISARLQRDG